MAGYKLISHVSAPKWNIPFVRKECDLTILLLFIFVLMIGTAIICNVEFCNLQLIISCSRNSQIPTFYWAGNHQNVRHILYLYCLNDMYIIMVLLLSRLLIITHSYLKCQSYHIGQLPAIKTCEYLIQPCISIQSGFFPYKNKGLF